MAGIQADANRSMRFEPLDQFRDLLEVAAQGALCPSCVFNQNAEIGSLPGQPIHGSRDRLGRELQALVACQPLPRTGMQHQVFGAQHQGAFDLAAESGHALLAKLVGLAANIDKVAGVDHERANVELRTLRPHSLGLLGVDLLRPPHPGTGGKDLQRVGADFVRPVYSIGGTTRRAQVYSDSLRHFPILTGADSVWTSHDLLGCPIQVAALCDSGGKQYSLPTRTPGYFANARNVLTPLL